MVNSGIISVVNIMKGQKIINNSTKQDNKSKQVTLKNIIIKLYNKHGLNDIEPIQINIGEAPSYANVQKSVYIDGLVYDAINSNEYFSDYKFEEELNEELKKHGLYFERETYSVITAFDI